MKFVSVWVGFERLDTKVDILKQRCGVASYEIGSQEVMVDDKTWRRQPVAALLEPLSYSESFAPAVVAAAAQRGIGDALYVVCQYDFAFDPKKTRRKVAADPIFLGGFEYDDEGEGISNEFDRRAGSPRKAFCALSEGSTLRAGGVQSVRHVTRFRAPSPYGSR